MFVSIEWPVPRLTRRGPATDLGSHVAQSCSSRPSKALLSYKKTIFKAFHKDSPNHRNAHFYNGFGKFAIIKIRSWNKSLKII
jgi:hypothetical protein